MFWCSGLNWWRSIQPFDIWAGWCDHVSMYPLPHSLCLCVCLFRMCQPSDLSSLRLGLSARSMHVLKQRRLRCLEPSQCVSVVTPTSGFLTCLSLETVEGRYLLSGGSRGSVHVHDLQEGALQSEPPLVANMPATGHHQVHQVSWYPRDTGMFVTSGASGCGRGGGTARVWDANSLRPVDTVTASSPLLCHALSWNALLATGEAAGELCVSDLRSGCQAQRLKHGGGGKRVLACVWSEREPRLLLSAGEDARLMLWDVRSSRCQLASLRRRDVSAALQSVQLCSGGYTALCVHTDGTVLLWDLFTGRSRLPPCRFRVESHRCEWNRQLCVVAEGNGEIVFCPSGKAVSCHELGIPPTSAVSSPSSCHCQSLCGHLGTVLACQFHQNSGRLVTTAIDGNLLVWTPDHDAEEALLAAGEELLRQDQWSDDEP